MNLEGERDLWRPPRVEDMEVYVISCSGLVASAREPSHTDELVNVFIKRRFFDGWRYATVFMSPAILEPPSYWKDSNLCTRINFFKGQLFARDDIDYVADKSALEMRCHDVHETEMTATPDQLLFMTRAYRKKAQNEGRITDKQVVEWWRKTHGGLPDAYLAREWFERSVDIW